MNERRTLQLALAFLTQVAVGAAVWATDGVIEINQAKAVAGSVTPGDAPGFPVSLSTSGSYRLTSNLDLAAATTPVGVNGIELGTADISIDLNGFSVKGTPPGSGIGIYSGMTGTRARVENGFSRNFGGHGVFLLDGTVDGVVVNNTGNGTSSAIYVASGVVSRCIAITNNGNGIRVDKGVIESSYAAANSAAGFRLGAGILRGSATGANTTDELFCDAQCAFGENFLNCDDNDACYGGAGILLQVPAGSNMCGGAVCS